LQGTDKVRCGACGSVVEEIPTITVEGTCSICGKRLLTQQKADQMKFRDILQRQLTMRAIAVGIGASMLFWLAGATLSIRMASYNALATDAKFARAFSLLADDCAVLAFFLTSVIFLTCFGIFVDLIIASDERWVRLAVRSTDIAARVVFFVLVIGLGIYVWYYLPREPASFANLKLPFISEYLYHLSFIGLMISIGWTAGFAFLVWVAKKLRILTETISLDRI